MELQWIKCVGDLWCTLLTVNLDHSHFKDLKGVYIIWHGGTEPWTVYVGQGQIADRLRAHRRDPNILKYTSDDIFVTWAKVDVLLRDGVEHYLTHALEPKIGKTHPTAEKIPVNFPWVVE